MWGNFNKNITNFRKNYKESLEKFKENLVEIFSVEDSKIIIWNIYKTFNLKLLKFGDKYL